jgi:hypothetical protein
MDKYVLFGKSFVRPETQAAYDLVAQNPTFNAAFERANRGPVICSEFQSPNHALRQVFGLLDKIETYRDIELKVTLGGRTLHPDTAKELTQCETQLKKILEQPDLNLNFLAEVPAVHLN